MMNLVLAVIVKAGTREEPASQWSQERHSTVREERHAAAREHAGVPTTASPVFMVHFFCFSGEFLKPL